MGKALATQSEVCYNTRMEIDPSQMPLRMSSTDHLHEATLCTYDVDNFLYRLRKWISRAGVNAVLTSELCGRIVAAQDIIAAVRKELDDKKIELMEAQE